MRGLKSVSCLMPVLGLMAVFAPAASDVALAQADALTGPAPEQGKLPNLKNTPRALVIEVVKGSRTDRVEIGSGDPSAALDGRAGGGPADLQSTIELVKGGEVVVLTVVESGPNLPLAARIDSVKRKQGGPTSLLPFQSQVTGTARPGGPTSLIPSNPPAAGGMLRRGPTNLIPSQPQVIDAALRGGQSGPIPLQPQATGTTLEDRTAKPNPVSSPVTSAVLRAGPTDDGILVASVEQGGQAWRDGLRQGDVIASVNRNPVRDMAALETELESGGNTVVLEVRRGVNEIVVVLRR
jgi:S1-C subfamily serine protease